MHLRRRRYRQFSSIEATLQTVDTSPVQRKTTDGRRSNVTRARRAGKRSQEVSQLNLNLTECSKVVTITAIARIHLSRECRLITRWLGCYRSQPPCTIVIYYHYIYMYSFLKMTLSL